jgi:hypothetical protein
MPNILKPSYKRGIFLLCYHFSIHLDQFSYNEDGGTTFLRNIRITTTECRNPKEDQHKTDNDYKDLKTDILTVQPHDSTNMILQSYLRPRHINKKHHKIPPPVTLKEYS